MIKIEVHSTRAVIRSQEPLTVGLRGATARFSFGKPWEPLIKTAVFRQGEKTVTVADIGTEATIPWEVLTAPGLPVQIGVYGTDNTGAIAIPTVWTATQPVRPGTDPEGDPSTEPTPGLWEQLQGKMGSLEQLTTADKSSLVGAINEANQAVCLVTVSRNEDGTYTADKTSEELLAAYNNGKTLICYLDSLLLCLASLYNSSTFEFMTIKYNTKYLVTVDTDDSVSYSTEKIATDQSKLPNPKKLTFIGAAEAEYDGSEEVAVKLPTKLSQLENDEGYLTEAPVTSVNGRTGDITVPTPVKVTVTKQADGSYDTDLYSVEIMRAYAAGNVVYCKYGNQVLSLVLAAATRCIFNSVNEDVLHTVSIGTSTVTVTNTPLASGSGLIITDDGDGNVTVASAAAASAADEIIA